LAPLGDLAERRNIAIHTVTHPPKTTTSAMNAFIGSQAFIAASRMAHLTTEEMDEEGKPTGRFLMAMVRTSLGPKMPTLAYRLAQVTVGEDHRDGRPITGSYIVWEDGVVDISASAALAAASGGARGSSDDRSAMAEAEQFLQDKLGNGPIPAKDGEEHARAIGIAHRTLMRARKKLGVIAEKLDMEGGWTWRLPLPEECQATPKSAIKNVWHSSYPVGTLRGDGGTADAPTLGNGRPPASPPVTSSEQAPARGGNGHDSVADDGTIPAFLDRRHEVCAQCLAGRPDDPPTVAVTARNGETVYVHERGCLRFWEGAHGPAPEGVS